MKRAGNAVVMVTFALLASLVLPAPSSAALRSPQVSVLGTTLQTDLTGAGQTINVLTQQDATQSWTHTVSGTTEYTIEFQNSPNAALHTFGLYNSTAAVPNLVPLASGSVGVPGFSTAMFQSGGGLLVNYFDSGGAFISQQAFTGVDPSAFSFYLSGPSGTFYTQDARIPGGAAQALTYMGTGVDAGSWWLCWTEASVSGGGSNQSYADEVILLSSVNTTPVSKRRGVPPPRASR